MKNNQSHPKPGFMVQNNRQAKAFKILKIIEDAGKVRNSSLKLLDIGTGNGEIAFYLSQFFDVVSVDVEDQRSQLSNFSFMLIDEDILPFDDNYFDIVISNHVIEHVDNADLHLSEIHRVLKYDGLVYLATPNRSWPWEVHYRLLFLHYLPQPVFMKLLRYMGKYHEELNLLSWVCLKRKVKTHFMMVSASEAVCKWPQEYYLNVNAATAWILSLVPLFIYRFFMFINPTLIVLLKYKSSEPGRLTTKTGI